MNSLEKITKGQLQSGIVDAIQISGVTLYSTSWNLVGGYYTYVYNNTDIDSSSIVEVIPDKSSMTVVRDAQITPDTLSSTGTATFYAINAPTANITVTVNIYNTDDTAVYSANDWIRPTDWLTMPTIGTQEFIGLLAITDDESNHIALLCAGAYTVDWGDGVTENVATGVKAQHSYTYSSISDSTISSRGYKQVLVRVTPQAGQNLTTVSLNQQNSILAKIHTVGWLDLHYNGANITSIVYGGGAGTVSFHMVERVRINALGAITTFASLFSYLFSGLQTVTITGSSLVTNFSNIFFGCNSLKYVDLNVSAGNNFDSAFSGCNSLQKAPLLNFKTTGTIICTSMFGGCKSLREVPLINTIAVTAVNFMFSNCSSLQSIPLINTQSVTTFASFTVGCDLQQLPNLNTSAGTDFSSMIGGNSIAKAAFQGTRYSISYSGKCLSRNAVVDIFNGLGTAVGTPTITITTNPAFSAIPLNVSPTASWRGVTIQSSSQDVYVSNGTNGVYKQTGGVGPFVAESLASSAFYRGMGTDIYGNIYLATNLGTATDILKKTGGVGSWATISTSGISGGSSKVAGDYLGNLYIGTSIGLYKQTALTGSFVQVLAGNITSLSISAFDGSVYTIIGSVIYKQTAGTGTFNAVQTISGVDGLCCMPNGDVYASNGTLFKQTAGTGSFVSMGISVGTIGIANKLDGNLYALSTDVTYLDFAKVVTPTDRLIATNKGWTIA